MPAETLFELFERICRRFPGQTALECAGGQLTYAQLATHVASWNTELVTWGLRPGERVLIVVGEPLDFIAVWFALWQIRCVPIPLESSITTAELARAATESQAHWLVTSIPAHLETLAEVDPGTSLTQTAWVYARLEPQIVQEVSLDAALLFYTSGTTGTPKCVVFDHVAMAANVVSLAETIKLSESDVLFTPLSPVLPAALATAVLPALCSGATLVLPAQPIPGQILRKIATTGTTIFFAVPYLYELLSTAMALRTSDVWSNVRLCLTSSAFLQEHLFEKFYDSTHLPIRSVYCSSEAGACTFNDANDLSLIRESVGRALPGVELQIVDDEGQAALPGNVGQIVVRGAHVASGYFHRPDLQQQVFGGGWVRTGDLGAIDRTGYLRLSGRLSETINVSGYLVNPQEVEQVLLEHPAVAEALVYGLGDPQMGEVVAAKIVLVEGTTAASKQELLDACAGALIHYKMPRRIDFVHELPKSRYGKIDRMTAVSEDGG